MKMTNRSNQNSIETPVKVSRTTRGKRKLVAKLNRYGKKLVLSNAIATK